MCYFVNVLDLLWIWVFPGSTKLFIGCYLLTLGMFCYLWWAGANEKAHWLVPSSPGAIRSSSTLWIKSPVYSSTCTHLWSSLLSGKSTSSHLNELIVRHTLPNVEEKYPGLAGLAEYTWYQMIILAAVPCKLPQSSGTKADIQMSYGKGRTTNSSRSIVERKSRLVNDKLRSTSTSRLFCP